MSKQKQKADKPRSRWKSIVLYTVAILIGCFVMSLLGRASQSDVLPTEARLPESTGLDSELTVAAALESDAPKPTDVPSATATITQTPLPSDTPVPSAPPSLEDLVAEAVDDAMTAGRDDIEQLIVNDIVVTVRFPLTSISAGAARREAELMYPQLVCNLREAGLTNRTYQVTGMIDVVDSFGNSSTAKGVEMILPWSATEQINCENVYNIDLSVIAERWTVSPLLQ